jgi:hypothetical protein
MSDPLPPVERVVCNARVDNLEIEARTGIDGSYITSTEEGLKDSILVPLSDVRALVADLLDTAATLAGAAAGDQVRVRVEE